MRHHITLSGRSARALTRQIERMEQSTALAKRATSELSALHRYAAYQATTTVERTQHLVKAATYSGRMTPEKQAAFHDLTQAYLDDLTRIVEEAGFDLINLLAD
jgi:hypothetical protein